MNTEELIVNLASEAGPVTRLRPPAVRALSWLAVAAAFAVTGVAVLGLRPDVSTAVSASAFLMHALLAVGLTITAAVATCVIVIPGAEVKPLARSVSVATLVVWVLMAGRDVLAAGNGLADASDWPVCATRLAAIAMGPGVALWWMVRRSGALHWSWTAGLAATASLAAAALAIPFTCPVLAPSHVFLGHVAPVGVLAVVAALAAMRRPAL